MVTVETTIRVSIPDEGMTLEQLEAGRGSGAGRRPGAAVGGLSGDRNAGAGPGRKRAAARQTARRGPANAVRQQVRCAGFGSSAGRCRRPRADGTVGRSMRS